MLQYEIHFHLISLKYSQVYYLHVNLNGDIYAITKEHGFATKMFDLYLLSKFQGW